MGIKELKTKLIAKLSGIDDKNLLEEVYRLLETGKDETEIYHLNEKQISAVAEAQEQIKRGQTLSDEEADQEIKNGQTNKVDYSGY